MADKSTIFRGTIALSDTDQGRYESLQLTLAQHPSEKRERVTARLLAYTLSHEPGLRFSKGICEGDTPDILLQRPGEKMTRWIEVGTPAPERMKLAGRRADQVTFYLYSPQLGRWLQMHREQMDRHPELVFHHLEYEVLQRLAGSLTRQFNWSVTITADVIYVDTGSDTETLELQLPG